jgi:hypothetical protein
MLDPVAARILGEGPVAAAVQHLPEEIADHLKKERVMRFAFRLTILSLVVLLVSCATLGQSPYSLTRSTGPFYIPPNAHSVDWVVLNNSHSPQKFRMTVYRLPVGATKITLAPGALERTLGPGESMHNANSVGSVFVLGFAHEMIIESNSADVLPMAVSWSANVATQAIVGSMIPAADWVYISSR